MANQEQETDLQALMMFLLFEKQVISMDDDSSELERYYLDKHRQRMTDEINQYKQKMNMKYKPETYEITNGKETLYVYALTGSEAEYLAGKKGIYGTIRKCSRHEIMELEGKRMSLAAITKNKQAPQILGGY